MQDSIDEQLNNAAKNNDVNLYRYLINDLHANPSRTLTSSEAWGSFYPSKFSNTTLNHAIESNRIKVVQYLIEECNIDPNNPGLENKTAFHTAVFESYYILKYIVETCHPSIEAKCWYEEYTSWELLMSKDSGISAIDKEKAKILVSNYPELPSVIYSGYCHYDLIRSAIKSNDIDIDVEEVIKVSNDLKNYDLVAAIRNHYQ